MLSTINGIDLLLTIIITLLGFKVYNLNRECESYVGQILQVSWELQQEIQANRSELYEPGFTPAHQEPHKHEYQDYCACSACIPF